MKLSSRRAELKDLPRIIELLHEDDLGKTRESVCENEGEQYHRAFNKISQDANQYLMVVEDGGDLVGTCHLTLMPSLTFKGSMRMHIEGVRVCEARRAQGIGQWMFKEALYFGKKNDVKIIQLTTNKKRSQARHFYGKLGFEASHEGMKLYMS